MTTELTDDTYHVSRGAIVDGRGAILYEAECIADLSPAARRRLAKLHTEDPSLDWDGAEKILRAHGLMPVESEEMTR